MKEGEESPRYEMIKELGNGVFGFVFKALDKETNRHVAIKRVEKVGKALSREYEVLNELKDTKHCMKLIDIFYTSTPHKTLVQNMVFEYFEDDLEKVIQRQKEVGTLLSEDRIKLFAYQLIYGLKELHSKNIMHRDLKPENVLRNSKDILKIADFGSSKFIEKNTKSTPYIVSRYYRAPELILSISTYNQKIDIWAIGCIILDLLLLDPVFKGKSEGDQFFAILRKKGSMNREEIDYFSRKSPLISEYLERLTGIPQDISFWSNIYKKFSDAENAKSFFSSIFEYIPNKRLDAYQLLSHPFLEKGRLLYDRIQ